MTEDNRMREIEERCEAAKTAYEEVSGDCSDAAIYHREDYEALYAPVHDVSWLLAENLKLTAAVEEAKAYAEVNEQHEAAIMENYKDAIADRDRYKARAEGLERALGRVTPRCMWCRLNRGNCGHFNPPMPHGTPRSDDPRFYCEYWQFDEARFAEGGGE